MNYRNIVILLLIAFAALTRILPHPPNVAPITGIALFSAMTFNNKKFALTVPLICMFLSDIVLGFHFISFFVYLSFFIITFMGMKFKTISTKNILLSSTLFFLVTNFGVWLIGYPHTLAGLISCYTLAIPFFGNTILGDMAFTGALFYSFGYIQKKYLATA
tara:strand:- start:365 stop:847 length:483 start_codon:yes stop_codon:yes gene_type:complete